MKNNFKILIIIGIVVLAGAGGYFGYRYWQNKTAPAFITDLSSLNDQNAQDDYKANVSINTVNGILKSIDGSSIIITSQDQEKQYSYSDDLVMEKIAQDGSQKGAYIYVKAQKSDLVAGKFVKIVFNNNDQTKATKIMITEIKGENIDVSQ